MADVSAVTVKILRESRSTSTGCCPLNQLTETKHVEPKAECWRTRVQLPPPPPNNWTHRYTDVPMCLQVVDYTLVKGPSATLLFPTCALEAMAFGGTIGGTNRKDCVMPPKLLTDTKLKAAKPRAKPYKEYDSGGLHALVHPNGSKYWRLKYRRPHNKKENQLPFGKYPDVSIAQARRLRDEAKSTRTGQPGRNEKELAGAISADNSFEAVANAYLAKQQPLGRRYTTAILGTD